MKRIRNFVKNTFKYAPKEERDAIIEEVTQLLLEKVEDLMEKGLSKEEAINKTVVEFGTIDDFYVDPKRKTRKLKREKTIRHYRNDLLFSLVGSVIIIGMLVFANLYYWPGVIWFVLPSIAVLWWPLSVGYNLLNKKEQKRGDKDE